MNLMWKDTWIPDSDVEAAIFKRSLNTSTNKCIYYDLD